MRVRIKLLGLATVCFMSTAHAMCFNSPVADHEKSAEFMSSMVNSIASFESANTRVDSAGGVTVTDLLSAMDAADEDLRCAAAAMSGYEESHNATFADIAKQVRGTATGLQQLNAATRKALVDQLNGEYADEKPGDHAKRMAALQSSYRDTWNLLPSIATESFLAIEEFESPNTTKAARLSITTSDRDALNERLKSYFPTVVSNTTAANTQPRVAAAVIFEGLNHKGFQMHDQPYVERIEQ